MKKLTILMIPLTVALALVGCKQGTSETATPQPEAKETAVATPETTVQPVAKKVAITPKEQSTCSYLGQYLAVTAGLSDIKLSDEEKAAIIDGFQSVVNGESSGKFAMQQDSFTAIRDFLQVKRDEQTAIDEEVNKQLTAEFVAKLKEDPRITFTESGLGYTIKNPGEYEKPKITDTVAVTYRGTLIDGTEFDAALDPKNPASFPLVGVIKGFSEGLQLIGKGGEIRLYIPAELGYGNNTRPGSPIKAGAMLIFDVTMQEIYRPGEATQSIPVEMPPPPPPPSDTEEE